MAAEMDNTQFQEETRHMVEELARSDPAKLKELYEASLDMKKIMKEDPEFFQKTFQEYLNRLENGEVKGASFPGSKATASSQPDLTAPQPTPNVPPPSRDAPCNLGNHSGTTVDTASSSSPTTVPQVPEQDTTLGNHTEEHSTLEYQADDEVWYAPTQKQKRPSSVLARWSINSTAAKWKHNDDAAPLVYINVCESIEIDAPEAQIGAIPSYTSELVHHHVDVVLHPETLAAAKFDTALKEDVINLCLHKVLFFHKILVQHYTLGGPLLSVILGEVAGKFQSNVHTTVKTSRADIPKKAVAPEMPPVITSHVDIIQKDNQVFVHAVLKSNSAKNVDVALVGRNALRLQMPGTLPKDIALPCDVDEENYSCKFVRSSQTLKVTFRKAFEHTLD